MPGAGTPTFLHGRLRYAPPPGLDELGESAGTHQDLGRPDFGPSWGKMAGTHMEVTTTGGTPKWMVCKGKSNLNPFKWMIWGVPLF